MSLDTSVQKFCDDFTKLISCMYFQRVKPTEAYISKHCSDLSCTEVMRTVEGAESIF
jgi:hypothetical protein